MIYGTHLTRARIVWRVSDTFNGTKRQMYFSLRETAQYCNAYPLDISLFLMCYIMSQKSGIFIPDVQVYSLYGLATFLPLHMYLYKNLSKLLKHKWICKSRVNQEIVYNTLLDFKL